MHPWIPNSDPRVLRDLLRVIGVDSVEELYSDIPEEARFRGDWNSLPIGMGEPVGEDVVVDVMEGHLSRIAGLRAPPFMGGGVWPHYIPEAVRHVSTLGQMLTTYTPYQAEISQGLMQALFEYQSLIADLVEMDVVNTSMYDWSTALGEAGLMSMRVKRGRKRILVPETMNPRHRMVLEAYIEPKGGVVDVIESDPSSGLARVESLEEKIGDDVAAVYIEYPGYLGQIEENAELIGEIAHRAGALYIVGVEPISLALLKPPGRMGADIVVGEGQPLGIGLNYGGPYLGIFAVRWDARLVRQMPGRIIGMTRDAEGNRAFAMILQTREQHIRRAKATSNITTNEALMAIRAAAYLALLGGEGLRRVAETIWYNSHYLAKRLGELPGVESPLLESEFISDFIARMPLEFTKVSRELLGMGYAMGIPLAGTVKWLGERDGLITATEVHRKRDMDGLVDAVASIIGGV